jgi:hypothetical protein
MPLDPQPEMPAALPADVSLRMVVPVQAEYAQHTGNQQHPIYTPQSAVNPQSVVNPPHTGDDRQPEHDQHGDDSMSINIYQDDIPMEMDRGDQISETAAHLDDHLPADIDMAMSEGHEGINLFQKNAAADATTQALALSVSGDMQKATPQPGMHKTSYKAALMTQYQAPPPETSPTAPLIYVYGDGDTEALLYRASDMEGSEARMVEVLQNWSDSRRKAGAIYGQTLLETDGGGSAPVARMYIPRDEDPQRKAGFCAIISKGYPQNAEYTLAMVHDGENNDALIDDGFGPWEVPQRPFAAQKNRLVDKRQCPKPDDVFTVNKPSDDVLRLYFEEFAPKIYGDRWHCEDQLLLSSAADPKTYPSVAGISPTSPGHLIQHARPLRVGAGWGITILPANGKVLGFISQGT